MPTGPDTGHIFAYYTIEFLQDLLLVQIIINFGRVYIFCVLSIAIRLHLTLRLIMIYDTFTCTIFDKIRHDKITFNFPKLYLDCPN